ncbi:sulfite exporter TauE/SafE family protein [Sulfitobacter aestuarii]|uniref:Probable membrane transporter protein n=1 Tax=Sulfitobacter aestuarii TaxID=2161676 RepID=A0ABW5TZ66_9RHOB
MWEILLLCTAGFAAGALNAVAGGGTFLSLPALIYVGVPPVAANATATLSALPGYVGSGWAFRHDLRAEGRLGLRAVMQMAALGSLAGAGLLLVTSDTVFSGLVPWLLVLATALFALGPAFIAMIRKKGLPDAGPLLSALVILAVSIYGGYFNGGLGIMLLAAFGLLGYVDLHNMNGLKNVLSALLSLVSAVTFVVAGLIAWQAALPLALASALGGFIGAHYSRRITNTYYLRLFVIAVGAVMSVLFFLT